MTQETGKTILIAEDDPASRSLLSIFLRQRGFKVIETASGDEAVRQIREQLPDLAILDIMMPGMRGTEAATIIRRETQVPFLFLSALDETDVVQKAVDAGALGYLVKPLNLSQLLPSIHAALERADELRRLRTAETNLATALAVGRATSVAVGILMERHRLSQEAAFETLRSTARAKRKKVVEIADLIVGAAEALNSITPSTATPKSNPTDV